MLFEQEPWHSSSTQWTLGDIEYYTLKNIVRSFCLNNYHNEAIKLFKNIEKYSTVEMAEKIAYRITLEESASENQKVEWVNDVVKKLETEFDEHVIKDIRMGCYCSEDGKLDEAKQYIKSVYSESSSLDEFVELMNKANAGWYIEDGYLYTRYLSCSCPMLSSINRLDKKTWCYCTVGFNKKIFEYVFECEIDVELLEAIKLGDKQCLMKIIPFDKTKFDC